jgi:hypothetical protein
MFGLWLGICRAEIRRPWLPKVIYCWQQPPLVHTDSRAEPHQKIIGEETIAAYHCKVGASPTCPICEDFITGAHCRVQ